ncbi:MAG: LytTR family DNA-binding domain-containing protein [Rubrivivax sp.]
MRTAASPLRVLIVDDEPLARRRLQRLLAETAEPQTAVVGEAGDAMAALALLAATPVDLVLLDIAMPGLPGLEAARRIAALPAPPPLVVFVTAHGEHALQAFELDATDYLTKPVRLERLQAALQRAAQRVAARTAVAPGGALEVDTAEAPGATAVIVVNDRGRLVRVPIAEVLYLKAELKYVTLRTAAHRYVLDEALAELEQRLGDAFLRVHRNALVAVAAARELQRRPTSDLVPDVLVEDAAEPPGADGAAADGWAVRVAPTDEWLAVSRRQLQAVRQALAQDGRPGSAR